MDDENDDVWTNLIANDPQGDTKYAGVGRVLLIVALVALVALLLFR
jgi:hypothetical protein